MPLELGVWRIDKGLEPVEFGSMDMEARLEDILHQDLTIAAPHWMVIGRQVRTDFDKRIDLLAIDPQGNLVVLELKRHKTYRDIVAQVLDYGSWVRSLHDEDIAQIFEDYRQKYHADEPDISLDEAFCRRFGVRQMPDSLNDSHELVIVAATLDDSTERVVRYLSEHHGVNINAVFFRVFKDGDREYLSRAWLSESSPAEASTPEAKAKGEWNGEYYVSFGGSAGTRVWEEAVKYGFISGGGGHWYSHTLHMLDPGARVWVNIPGTGYVGVGMVTEPATVIDDFHVGGDNGEEVPIHSLPIKAATLTKAADNEEKAEYMVRVDWQKTVPVSAAVKEKGFFGNQNTVARPRDPKWDHTVDRLKKRFGVD